MGLLSAEEFFVIVGAVAVVVHLVVHIVAGAATQTSRSAHGAVAAVVG